MRVKHYFKLSLKKSISMDEVRRTIMNEFSDEKSCDMFIMLLKEKWSSFKGDLAGKCTVEIVRDSNDPCRMSAILTFEHLDDFLLISNWAEEQIIPYRDSLSPKTQTFSGVVEAKFQFT